jgi:dipeptidase
LFQYRETIHSFPWPFLVPDALGRLRSISTHWTPELPAMASDMVVALARATIDGQTLFGHNCNRFAQEAPEVVRVPGRSFAPGEMVRAAQIELPEVRQTIAVLASRRKGEWGYHHGVNQNGVAVGLTHFRARLSGEGPGLTGPDLVRLALERAHDTRHAIELLIDLLNRHGQTPAADQMTQGEVALANALMIADGTEAYVLAACGHHWAMQAIGRVRALGEVCHVRQDWDRISRGLADLAITRGWWPEDGSKLDFGGAVCVEGPGTAASFRRWGQSTLKLEQHCGQIDLSFLRRLLAEHSLGRPDESDLRKLAAGETGRLVTSASLVAQLSPVQGQQPLVWFAFGSPCASVYFPLSFDADPPTCFQGETGRGHEGVWRRTLRLGTFAGRGPRQRSVLREAISALQARLDQHAAEFHTEADLLRQRGAALELHRLAEAFLEHNAERWEEVCAAILEGTERPMATAPPAPVFVG